jgi:hypothetical protein
MIKKRAVFYRQISRALLYGVLMVVTSLSAAAQTATFTTQSHPLLGNTHLAADFNGDGKLDLAGSGAMSAAVMINNGDATFQPKIEYPVAGYTEDLAAGDFNGDGKLDLVVTINTPHTSLSLVTGRGDGTFNPPVNFPNTSGFDSPSVVAADLNNDGRLDVAVMHSINCYDAPCVAAQTISVMLGNGDGTFQPTRELAAGKNMHRMTAGDFNRDGINDLAIGSENTELYILLGVGDGTFAQKPAMTAIPGGDSASAINDLDVADFNRDTIQDLVVALGNGDGNMILLGNGDGTFRRGFQIIERATQAPLNLAVADYNGDGFQDVARAMGYGNLGLMEIANGNSDGTFQPPVRYLVPTAVTSEGGLFITASDFNGDGKPDIALEVGGAGNSLKVLINTTGTQPAPAALLSLTMNPSSTTGGTTSTGMVELNMKVQAATTVRLSSNSAAAAVPSSVTVAAGASSASFTVKTTQVSATTTATVTATLNGTSRSAVLTISSATPTPSVDTVSIARAEYESAKRTLRVEAASTRADARLQVFVTSTGQLVGTLTNNGGGRFSGQFSLSVNPQSITVRSSLGGQATRAVTVK